MTIRTRQGYSYDDVEYLYDEEEAEKQLLWAQARNTSYGNLALGVLGLGLESLGGVGVVEGSSRDILAVGAGSLIMVVGYLSENGGFSSNAKHFLSYMIDGFSYEPAPTEAQPAIDSPPVIV